MFLFQSGRKTKESFASLISVFFLLLFEMEKVIHNTECWQYINAWEWTKMGTPDSEHF